MYKHNGVNVMNYSTKTIQLSIDEFPTYNLSTMQIPLNHYSHRTGILRTKEQIKEVEAWNQQEAQQRFNESQILKEHNQFPKFYQNEISRSFWNLLFSIILLIAFIGGMVAICLSIASNNRSWHLLWLTIPLFCFVFFIVFKSITNFCSLRNEAKFISFSNYEKIPSANITRIYQKAKINHINLNWFCFAVYLISTLIIIVSLTVAWAYNLIQSATQINEFGALQIYATKDWWPLYSVVTCGIIMSLCLIYHLSLLIINVQRVNAINAYFGNQIIPESEIIIIKKSINKRDAIIFGCLICFLCLAGVFAYKFIRKILMKKQK